MQSFDANPQLENLLMDQGVAKSLTGLERRWRDTVRAAKEAGVPLPAIGSALDYYDGYRSEVLPANLIQLLRDRFGAHGFERLGQVGEFHGSWGVT